MACTPLDDAKVAGDYRRCYFFLCHRLFAFAYVCLFEYTGQSHWNVTNSYFRLLFHYHTVNAKLPFTMSPEYIAAQRAYMRYHNMNPIYGRSSKYVGSELYRRVEFCCC